MHRAPLALEQRRADQVFELADGMADGAGRNAQLLARHAERAGAGGGFKGVQGAKGQLLHAS
jgi:hypothetical protein